MKAKEAMNFERLHILVVDDNPNALNILAQVLAGFGVRSLSRAQSAQEAQAILTMEHVDLMLTDAGMPETDGYDLVFWLRHEAPLFNRHMPVLVVTGHTRRNQVQRARDCGAHFVVTKPITPQVILERIHWCAKSQRMMMECENYAGPDRRFRQAPVDQTLARRRHDNEFAVVAG